MIYIDRSPDFPPKSRKGKRRLSPSLRLAVTPFGRSLVSVSVPSSAGRSAPQTASRASQLPEGKWQGKRHKSLTHKSLDQKTATKTGPQKSEKGSRHRFPRAVCPTAYRFPIPQLSTFDFRPSTWP